jgi:hypothetical protein
MARNNKLWFVVYLFDYQFAFKEAENLNLKFQSPIFKERFITSV